MGQVTTRAEARRLHARLAVELRGLHAPLPPEGVFLRPVGHPNRCHLYEVVEHYDDEENECTGLMLTVWSRQEGQWKAEPRTHWRSDIRRVRGGVYRCLGYVPDSEGTVRHEAPYYREVQSPRPQGSLF